MKKRVCFSIVCHGHSSLIDLLLADIDKNVMAKDSDLKVLITDNVGENCWKPQLQNFKLQKIVNLREKGFGANHNAAYEMTRADIFVVINPDVRIFEPFDLDKFVDHMADMTVCAPRIINMDGLTEDYKRKEITLLNLIRRRVKIAERGEDKWFSGIFQAYTGKTFSLLRGFDTRYFMYVEDADICNRLLKRGGFLRDISFVTVTHDARRQSLKKVKHFCWHVTSLLIYFLKRVGFLKNG